MRSLPSGRGRPTGYTRQNFEPGLSSCGSGLGRPALRGVGKGGRVLWEERNGGGAGVDGGIVTFIGRGIFSLFFNY